MQQGNSSRRATRRFTSDRSAQSLIVAAAVCGLAGLYSANANADVVAYWDFNTSSTSPTSFNSNLGAVPLIGEIGGVTSNFATGNGSGDPTQPGQGFNTLSYPNQGTANKTGGVQFSLNTSNFDVSNFTFDWRSSNSSSRWMGWQYTLNGSSWLDGGSFSSTGGDQWNNGKTIDLSGIAAADNNANFGLRLVAMFSPDGFTQSTTPNQTFGPNAGYRAANADDRAYATTSTWRFDSVTLNGTYNDVAFTATNLTWNSASGNWDTNGTNKPWLNPSAVASAFAQAGGKGDNVTFNNPAANSVVTVQAGAVTPNTTTITNSATLTFTGGSIGGTGGLVKNGTGRLILANSNTFTSANNPSSINAGVVETRANNGLGGGTVSMGNATWNSTTTAQTANNLVNLTGPVTFQTDANLTINNGLSGSGVITKTGAATLGIAGVSSNAGSINLTAGTTRMDSMGALGGLFATGVTGSTMNINNATLVLNATGSSSGGLDVRLSDNVTLNNGTISRNQLTAGLGPNPTNGDSELSSYANGIAVGGTFTVSGSSTIANLETRTAGSSDPAGGGGSNNAMVVRMPVLVKGGSTLTLFAANGTLSNVTGVPTGNIGNTAVALRGPDTSVNPNDSVTLQPGATLVMAGPGDKRIGSSNQGKPIVGRGSSAAEATIRADGRTYMTDIAVDNINTIFVVAGSGTGGLRIEAPMNADYSGVIPTSGFFGLNPDQSPETLGNIYTIMSPSRFAGIASGGPTQGVDGAPINRGGVLMLAASDPAGATGTINNGPDIITPVALGLDNTTASGPIVYQIDPTGAGGKIANFSGLVLKRGGPSTVTTRLLSSTSMETLNQIAGTLDLNGKFFTTGGATLVSGNTIGGGTISAQFLATKTGAGTYTLGAGSRIITPLLSVSSGTLSLSLDGSSASTSRVGTLSIAAGATMDLVDNDLIATSTSVNVIQAAISSARNAGAWNQTGLTSSAARIASPKNKTLGVLKGSEYIGANGSTFDGFNVGSNDTLVKFTYYGDTDFNGLVDFDDYSRIDAGFNNNRTGWFNGDVDYNGIVDFDDYSLIDQAFNTQSGTLRRAMSYLDGSDRSDAGMEAPSLQLVMDHLGQFGAQYAAGFLASVPEPSLCVSISVMAMTSLGRRRRTR